MMFLDLVIRPQAIIVPTMVVITQCVNEFMMQRTADRFERGSAALFAVKLSFTGHLPK
jgi:hypothetical protein